MSQEDFATHGAFSWCELRTGDPDTATTFYTQVLGYTTEGMDMPDGGTYTVLKAGDQSVGGIMKMPEAAGNAPAHWMGYITVDNVDDRIAKAEAAGGSVMMPAMDVPGVGRMATIADPTGGAISIITYAPREE